MGWRWKLNKISYFSCKSTNRSLLCLLKQILPSHILLTGMKKSNIIFWIQDVNRLKLTYGNHMGFQESNLVGCMTLKNLIHWNSGPEKPFDILQDLFHADFPFFTHYCSLPKQFQTLFFVSHTQWDCYFPLWFHFLLY